MYRIRHTGADIPLDMACAVEKEGTVVGYAKTTLEAEAFIKQTTDSSSHAEFFSAKRQRKASEIAHVVGNQLADEDPREARQNFKRLKALEAMFDNMVHTQRVPHGGGPNVRFVTWEQAQSMHNEYQDAVKSNDGSHKDFPFQPLSAYAVKVSRIRPLFQNEFGVFTNRNGEAFIIILQDRGPGDIGEKYFQVPDSVKKDA